MCRSPTNGATANEEAANVAESGKEGGGCLAGASTSSLREVHGGQAETVVQIWSAAINCLVPRVCQSKQESRWHYAEAPYFFRSKCWSNGTMTGMEKMETVLTIQHYAATNPFGGVAKSVQRARYTAGRLGPPLGPPRLYAKGLQDALVVLGTSFASATVWEQFVQRLLLIFDVEKNGVTAAEVTSSTHTKYSWLSNEPGAKKRSVAQRTTYTRKQLILMLGALDDAAAMPSVCASAWVTCQTCAHSYAVEDAVSCEIEGTTGKHPLWCSPVQ